MRACEDLQSSTQSSVSNDKCCSSLTHQSISCDHENKTLLKLDTLHCLACWCGEHPVVTQTLFVRMCVYVINVDITRCAELTPAQGAHAAHRLLHVFP